MAQHTSDSGPPSRRGVLLLAIAYLGFVSLGLPDAMAGVAWPSVRDAFTQPQSGFGLVFVALGCGYCLSSFFGGRLTLALGVGRLLTLSSLLVALAMFGSGLAPIWLLFVGCAIVWGLGSGAIDAGLNGYASTHFSARHVNWLHACYSLGATLGPLLMTATLVWVGSWRLGYSLIGGIVLMLTATFLLTRRGWDDGPKPVESDSKPAVDLRTALQEPLVWIQIILFFLYTGLEFTVGQWTFTVLTESRITRMDVAGVMTGMYFGTIGVGRVLFGFVANRVSLDQLVRYSMLLAFLGTLWFAFTSADVANIGLIAIGLGLAPVYPCLMATTRDRLGAEYAMHAVGFQVSSAMLGAVLAPGVAGLLADGVELEAVCWFAIGLSAVLWATHELLLYLARRRSEPSPG